MKLRYTNIDSSSYSNSHETESTIGDMKKGENEFLLFL